MLAAQAAGRIPAIPVSFVKCFPILYVPPDCLTIPIISAPRKIISRPPYKPSFSRACIYGPAEPIYLSLTYNQGLPLPAFVSIPSFRSKATATQKIGFAFTCTQAYGIIFRSAVVYPTNRGGSGFAMAYVTMPETHGNV